MKVIDVVGAAIIDKNKVLAAQRSIHMYPPLKWEFPGGKIEEGETHQEALCREINEELGIEIMVKNFVASGSFDMQDKSIRLHVYEAEITKGKPSTKEHNMLKWIDISDIGRLDWADADIPACKELLNKYNKNH